MINKTPLGVAFFDAEYGGVYRDRSVLVTGRAGSGKTMVGLHFLAQGLRLQERGLMLSTKRAEDLAIMAHSLGIPVGSAIETGDVAILEYNEFVPGRDQESNIMLPPDGFMQLKEIIEANAIRRVVIDTVLPWITLPNPAHLAEHIFSMVRAFERLGVTAVFTLPQPVSTAAIRLRKMLEDVVPISLTLQFKTEQSSRLWLVNKYLGQNPGAEGLRYDILPQKGIVAYAARDRTAPAVERPGPLPPAPGPGADAVRSKARSTSFAALVLNQATGGARPAPGPGAANQNRGA